MRRYGHSGEGHLPANVFVVFDRQAQNIGSVAGATAQCCPMECLVHERDSRIGKAPELKGVEIDETKPKTRTDTAGRKIDFA